MKYIVQGGALRFDGKRYEIGAPVEIESEDDAGPLEKIGRIIPAPEAEPKTKAAPKATK